MSDGRVGDDVVADVFSALASPVRRHLLDCLFERDGRTLGELERELEGIVEMTRFGVMKHLKVLEDAGLVITRRSGREKLHYLNPVPIRLIHDRWIDKYTERRKRCEQSDARADAESSPKTAKSVHGIGSMGVLSGMKTLLETGRPLFDLQSTSASA